MTICKFWQQGNCRNGNSCRFEHPGAGGGGGGRGNGNNRGGDNRFGALSGGGGGGGGGGKFQSGLDKYRISTDQIKTDLTEDAPTWILSAYAPGRDAPEQLFGGPAREQSFEEMRLRHLEARAAGNEQAALNDAQSMYADAQRQMQHAVSNAGQAAQFVLEGENKRPNRFDICREGTQGAPFGKFALGSRPAGGQQQQQSANPFGAPSGPSSGFGQPSLFGGPPAATQTPAFGQPSQPGAFGQPSGFGQPSFGQPSALGGNPSGFGKPAFGQPSQPGGSAPAFGQPSQPGPASGFGQPSALGQKPNPFGQPAFGQPSQPSAPSGFGQPSQPAAPSGFGQPSQPAAPSGFGRPSQPAAPSGFAQPSQPAAPSGFGQPSQPAATQNPFGQPLQPAFGQPSMPGGGATAPFGQSAAANSNPFDAKPSNPFSMDGPGVDDFRKPLETATKSDPFSMNGPGANTFRNTQSQPAANPFGSAAPSASNALVNPYPPTSTRTHPPLESYADRGPDGRLTGFKGRPVTYRDGVPGYMSQDGRWHRVYFPDGPPALNNDTALPDDQYDDVTRSQWDRFAQTGTFLNGLLPALAPPRDCTRWDF